MSRYTIGAYPRLYLKKRKKSQGSKMLMFPQPLKNFLYNFYDQFFCLLLSWRV